MFARASRGDALNSCRSLQPVFVPPIKGVRYPSRSTKGLPPRGITREPSSAPADGQLPPWEEWKDRFYYNGVAKKPTLHNLVTARKLVEGFGISDTTTPKVILETFAGPGVLSRALCELPSSKMSKLIIMEDNPLYLPYLESLAKIDKRVIVRPYNGWFWDSYSKITEEGILNDVGIEDWDNSKKHSHPSHSKLHFVATTLPWGESGETLFNQMFRAVATRDWLFKYGPMAFSAVMPFAFWKRAAARGHDKLRCKLSVMVEATTEAEEALPLNALTPHATHFFPPNTRQDDFMVAANFHPLGYQVMRIAGVEEWDFVLRALFINKSKPISQTLKSMAPGAQNLIKYLDPKHAGMLEKSPLLVTVGEWAHLMEAFQSWPFHPSGDALHDSIKTSDKRI